MSSCPKSLRKRETLASEKQRPHFPGSLRGIQITRASGDDRSHHQNLPQSCEAIRIAYTCVLTPLSQECADRFDVADRRMPNGVPQVTLFEQRFHERTTFEIGPAEPLVECIEHRKQASPGGSGPAFHLFLQPSPRPQFLTTAEESKRELVFGRIVPIQRHFRHA